MKSVSIIVPTFNRPKQLRACLTSLAALEGGPYPTYIVDDGGQVALEPIVQDFGAHVHLVKRDNGGPGAARNTGVAACETELVCFTDDDCAPNPNWVQTLVKTQNGAPMRLVGGRIENALTQNVFSAASQSLSTYLYEYYQSDENPMSFFTTNNMCCRREDFLSIDGFDAAFRIASEDRDYSLRWKDAGGTMLYEPGALVMHSHDLSFASFWKQHRNYGRGARYLHRALDARKDARPKVEHAGFYTGLLTHPLKRSGHARLGQSFLMGLSQVAMVSGYYAEVRKERAGRHRNE
ncbi:MAG: glycosyltransferase family 2 protein [Sedimentitalea sp.]